MSLGLALSTKGRVCRTISTVSPVYHGGGGAVVTKEEERPLITVTKVTTRNGDILEKMIEVTNIKENNNSYLGTKIVTNLKDDFNGD